MPAEKGNVPVLEREEHFACPRCGAPFTREDRFCARCGGPVSPPEAPHAHTQEAAPPEAPYAHTQEAAPPEAPHAQAQEAMPSGVPYAGAPYWGAAGGPRTSAPPPGGPAGSAFFVQRPSPGAERGRRRGLALFLALTVLVVLGAAAGAWAWQMRPIARFSRALSAQQYETAAALYEAHAHEASFAPRAERSAMRALDAAYADYSAGERSYESALAAFEGLQTVAKAPDALADMKKIEHARETFRTAEDAAAAGDYAKALRYYEAVTGADAGLHALAQEQIPDIAARLCAQSVSRARELLEEEAFIDAYEALDALKPQYRSDEAKALLERVRTEANAHIVVTASEMTARGDHIGAYRFVHRFPAALVSDEAAAIREGARAAYIASKRREAKEYGDAGDFDAAIAVLELAGEELSPVAFDEDIAHYERLRSASVVKAAKAYVTVGYDKIGKLYEIVPKGLSTEGTNLSASRCMQPWLRVADDGTVSFTLYFGFVDDYAINMDSALVDCDGRQFDLVFREEYLVHSGTETRATELSFVMDLPPWMFEQLAQLPEQEQAQYEGVYYDLFDMMQSMRAAQTVTVRFRGLGSHDRVVASGHIEQAFAMWLAYLELFDDPTLVEYLK